MDSFSSYLAHDHAQCDGFFADAEAAAAAQDWAQADARYAAFRQAMAHHFAMEESVLFPAFEAATGSTAGPTQVMRSEHAQMNGLFAEMTAALAARDATRFLGHAETLLWLMRQHNAKEENILYPMSDRTLAPQRAELIARMKALP